MAELSLIVAFLAGIVSFLSPCVLPLIPAFLGYLAGTTGDKPVRMKTFLNSVAYVLGFSSIFALLGVLLNGLLVDVSYAVQTWLSRIGGIIIVAFGLYLLELISIPWLSRDHRIDVSGRDPSYITSFLFGAAFAVGWSPCVGAVLGSVLALAASQPGLSFALLTAYALGLGVPFLIVGLFTTEAKTWIRKFGPAMKYFNIVVGIFLLILGVLVFTQSLSLLANLGFVNSLILG